MAKVLIAGGGLAGLAAAAALGGAGFEVEVFEARPFLGGRATSYPLPASNGASPEVIDNCQHVLMRCCVNLLDFYGRLGVGDRIRKILLSEWMIWKWHHTATSARGSSVANTELPSKRVSMRLAANTRTALSSNTPEMGSSFHAIGSS